MMRQIQSDECVRKDFLNDCLEIISLMKFAPDKNLNWAYCDFGADVPAS